MLNLADDFFKLFWTIFKSLIILAFLIFIKFLNVFFGLIDLFFYRNNKLKIKISGSDFFYFRSFFKKFSQKMDTDRCFRRWVISAFFIFAALYLYPPSHWGPWYFYQKGVASFYSKGFLYRHAADGSLFKPYKYTAAHKTLPSEQQSKL